ncbi:MAG: hypothetical protein IT374_00285 [Polyangiaceae bacterium]|nr:hypothetical protein [Polyangiaceae bacterium]
MIQASLKSEQLRAALDRYLASGDRLVFSLLTRHGGLPGPKPNHELAAAFASELLGRGRAGDGVLRELLAGDADTVRATLPVVFLPVVGAHALAARLAAGFDARASAAALSDLASDVRKVVRDGVVAALVGVAGRVDLLGVPELREGFLAKSVLLEALSTRSVCDRVARPAELVALLDAAATEIVDAPRSSERSQGRRRLLEAIGETAPVFFRFPEARAWLIGAAGTPSPELRLALERVVSTVQRQGVASSELDPVRAALDASAPTRRDPLSYKGPTRGRGRKRDRRAERK